METRTIAKSFMSAYNRITTFFYWQSTSRTALIYLAVLRNLFEVLARHRGVKKGKGKSEYRSYVDSATAEALGYMARTKQRRKYLS